MEERKKVDRLSIIKNLILVAFVVILVKILYMTTFKYEHYTELAENKTYKQLLIKAPRGEIKDRYGRLLAGNKNLFTVQVSGDEIKRKDSNGKSMANDICLKLINLLEKNNEEYIDEFPIYIQNGKYFHLHTMYRTDLLLLHPACDPSVSGGHTVLPVLQICFL